MSAEGEKCGVINPLKFYKKEAVDLGYSLNKFVVDDERDVPNELMLTSHEHIEMPTQICGSFSWVDRCSGGGISEVEKYAFEEAIGRANAKFYEELGREKMRENTTVRNQLTDLGFIRGKTFADGTRIYSPLTETAIESGKRWAIGGEDFFKLKIRNLMKGTCLETPTLPMDLLEDEHHVELLLSKYFRPSDTRAYHKDSIRELRSRLYEFLNDLPVEEVFGTLGWHKGDLWHYTDGREHPVVESLNANFLAPKCDGGGDINLILMKIASFVTKYDFENNIAFLLGFGLVNWLRPVCGVEMLKLPNLMLLGEVSICCEYAEALLMIYGRKKGSGIITLAYATENEIANQIRILRDDVLTLNAHSLGRRRKLLSAILTQDKVMGQVVKVPIVVLKDALLEVSDYCNCMFVDLYDFPSVNELLQEINWMKGVIRREIESLEVKKIVEMVFENEIDEEAEVVMMLLERVFCGAGAKRVVIDNFLDIVRNGIKKLKHEKCVYENATIIFAQRLRKAIHDGKIELLDISDVVAGEEENALWVKGENAYVPVQYLKNYILPMVNITASEFKVIRSNLIKAGVMKTYENGTDYTKKVVFPTRKRVHVYEFEKKFLQGVE